MNCSVEPFATDGSTGESAIETSVAGVTVSVVEPERPPANAVIVVEPGLTAVAKPFVTFDTVAAVAFVDVHVAVAVRSCVEPFVKIPVAVYCSVLPSATDAFVGVTSIDASVAPVTVNVVEPVTPPKTAEIVVEPGSIAVARPCEPLALEIVAAAIVVDDHVACV